MGIDAWPVNDRLLVMVTRYVGEGMAYEKLERHAICCAEGDVQFREFRMVYGDHEYRQALLDWDPVREMMPAKGYSA